MLSKTELTILAAATYFGVTEVVAYWKRRPRVVELLPETVRDRASLPEVAEKESLLSGAGTSPHVPREELPDVIQAPLWGFYEVARPGVRDAQGDIWFRCACCQ